MKDGIAKVGALEIAYDVQGSGPPLLLVPGFGMSRLMWEPAFCERLVKDGFTVVRMDNRDTGLSTRLDALGVPDVKGMLWRSIAGLKITPPYTLEDMANDGVGVMTSLGYDRFHVVGDSMGGMIAQTMAIEHGHRLLTMTSVSSTAGGRRYSFGDPRATLALLKPPQKDPAKQLAQYIELFRVLNGDVLPFDEAGTRAFLAQHVATSPSPAGAARQFAAILDSSGRRRAKLSSITTPTLVIHGTADSLLPVRGAKATARLVRNGTLVLVEGMGHLLHAQVMSQLTDAIAAHAGAPR